RSCAARPRQPVIVPSRWSHRNRSGNACTTARMSELAWSSSCELSSSARSSMARSESACAYARSTAWISPSSEAGGLPSLPKQDRICRWSSGWRFGISGRLGEQRDRHRLVVKLAARAGRERRDLAVGIEAREHRRIAQHAADRLHLLLHALLEHEL